MLMWGSYLTNQCLPSSIIETICCLLLFLRQGSYCAKIESEIRLEAKVNLGLLFWNWERRSWLNFSRWNLKFFGGIQWRAVKLLLNFDYIVLLCSCVGHNMFLVLNQQLAKSLLAWLFLIWDSYIISSSACATTPKIFRLNCNNRISSIIIANCPLSRSLRIQNLSPSKLLLLCSQQIKLWGIH